MAVHKLKPIEERDPYAAAVLDAFDNLGNKMNPIYRELKTARVFAACLHDEHSLDEAEAEFDRLLIVELRARQAIEAFEALGKAQHAGELLMARGNCETAMVALKAALFNTEAKGPRSGPA